MPRPQKVTLSTIGNGAAEQQFQKLIRDVHANVKDPNTKPDAKRKITLTLTFAPGADRDLTVVMVDSKVSLAPPAAKASQVFFGTERGEPVVTANDLNQYDLDDEAEAADGVKSLSARIGA
jgi:hypothetical protein